jgi:hypothetical protein
MAFKTFFVLRIVPIFNYKITMLPILVNKITNNPILLDMRITLYSGPTVLEYFLILST